MSTRAPRNCDGLVSRRRNADFRHSIRHSGPCWPAAQCVDGAAWPREDAHFQGFSKWRDPDSNRGHHDFRRACQPLEPGGNSCIQRGYDSAPESAQHPQIPFFLRRFGRWTAPRRPWCASAACDPASSARSRAAVRSSGARTTSLALPWALISNSGRGFQAAVRGRPVRGRPAREGGGCPRPATAVRRRAGPDDPATVRRGWSAGRARRVRSSSSTMCVRCSHELVCFATGAAPPGGGRGAGAWAALSLPRSCSVPAGCRGSR
jgi:hypothetical protein